MAHNQVHQAAFEEAEQIAHRGEDDVFHIGFGHHFGQRVGKVFQHQDGGGAAVFQLVLQFARGVERVDVHHDAAGLQNAEYGHGVLQQVGQHHGHARAFFQLEHVLQIGGELLGQARGLGIGLHLAEVGEAGTLAVEIGGFVEYFAD